MSGFDKSATAEQVSEGIDLAGRHAIVTGANSGIGFETARVLALRGSSVTLACRNLEKAERARATILASAHGAIFDDRIEVRELDLASLASVRDFAKEFLDSGQSLQLLVNNAGVMIPAFDRTSDGFEAHFGINHLGHFLLTELLSGLLEKSAPSRVVNVSSDALAAATLTAEFFDLNWEQRKLSKLRAYGDSKLMNVMHAVELTRRLESRGVVGNALHPGIVKTELGRDQPWYMKPLGLLMLPMMKEPDRGASTSVYVATADAYAIRGGLYFADNAEKPPPKLALDADACVRLWEISAQRTSLAEA
jgi:NAD(P)-dependent dehydrogenase (short-subunit alcohol dehydrogenase family)